VIPDDAACNCNGMEDSCHHPPQECEEEPVHCMGDDYFCEECYRAIFGEDAAPLAPKVEQRREANAQNDTKRQWVEFFTIDDDDTAEDERNAIDNMVREHAVARVTAVAHALHADEHHAGDLGAKGSAYSLDYDSFTPAEKLAGMDREVARYQNNDCIKATVTKVPYDAIVAESKWVNKAEFKDGRPCPKSRYCQKGFQDRERGTRPVQAPTATGTTHRTFEIVARAEDFYTVGVDLGEAFYHGIVTDRGNIYTVAPKHTWKDPEIAEYWHLNKETPGWDGAPRAFYLKVDGIVTVELKFVRSKVVACGYYLFVNGKLMALLSMHVDDMRLHTRTLDVQARILSGLRAAGLKIGSEVHSKDQHFTGDHYVQTADATYIDRADYIKDKLELVDIDDSKLRGGQQVRELTKLEDSLYETSKGQYKWATRIRPDAMLYAHQCACAKKPHTAADVLALNKAIRHLKHRADKALKLPVLKGPLRVVGIGDSSLANEGADMKTTGGFMVGIAEEATRGMKEFPFALIKAKSHTIGRVVTATFDAECLELVEVADESLTVKLVLDECVNGPVPGMLERAAGIAPVARAYTPVDVFSDAEGVVTNVNGLATTTMNKRRVMDIAYLREAVDLRLIRSVVHCSGKTNPTNPLTKRTAEQDPSRKALDRVMEEGILTVA